jgi:hypothetical protein
MTKTLRSFRMTRLILLGVTFMCQRVGVFVVANENDVVVVVQHVRTIIDRKDLQIYL